MFLRTGLFLLRNRPALIHCAGDTVFNYAVCVWAWMLRIPLVKERTMNSDFLRPRFRRALFRLVHRYARLCIALNRSIADQFREAGVNEERIFCRPNPVDCHIFKPPSSIEKERARQAFDLDEGACLHVVVGRFCPRKNQLQAVEALNRLPENHYLLLVGPVLTEDDSSYLNELRDRVSALELAARVRIIPESAASVICFYQAADSLWISSLAEGTPNVMLEALCTGVPVLVNEKLGLQDYIENRKNGLRVDFSGEHFPARLEELLCRVDSIAVAKDAFDRYSAEQIDSQHLCRIEQAISQLVEKDVS